MRRCVRGSVIKMLNSKSEISLLAIKSKQTNVKFLIKIARTVTARMGREGVLENNTQFLAPGGAAALT